MLPTRARLLLLTRRRRPQITGEPLYQRPDDNPTAVMSRLELYRKETLPVLDVFRKQGKVVDIDAAQKEDKVWKDVVAALGPPTASEL